MLQRLVLPLHQHPLLNAWRCWRTCGTTGQLGAACAGWPLQQLATAYGWTSIGYVNCVCGLLAALAFSPLWNVQVGNDAQKKQ